MIFVKSICNVPLIIKCTSCYVIRLRYLWNSSILQLPFNCNLSIVMCKKESGFYARVTTARYGVPLHNVKIITKLYLLDSVRTFFLPKKLINSNQKGVPCQASKSVFLNRMCFQIMQCQVFCKKRIINQWSIWRVRFFRAELHVNSPKGYRPV